jgi:hypothetical protein
MRLFRRMWIWTQCDEDYVPKQGQRRRRANKIIDQSGAWERLNVSSIGIATTTTTGRFRNSERVKTSPTYTSFMSWWKIVLLLLSFMNVFYNTVEAYVVAKIDGSWMRTIISKAPQVTTTASRLVRNKAPLQFKRKSFRPKNVRGMLLVNDDDECVDDDEIVPHVSDDGAAEIDDNTVLGEIYDTSGVVLRDLSWRVEKLRLEEQNIQRFLKARPRFLPYNECRKWVQAFNRWQTEDDWNEWIAMGEKRNAYIPVRHYSLLSYYSCMKWQH